MVLSAGMGLFQEVTYKKYGKQWREGLFYTVREERFFIIMHGKKREILNLLFVALPRFTLLFTLLQGFVESNNGIQQITFNAII